MKSFLTINEHAFTDAHHVPTSEEAEEAMGQVTQQVEADMQAHCTAGSQTVWGPADYFGLTSDQWAEGVKRLNQGLRD